jgi:hypothetical protein
MSPASSFGEVIAQGFPSEGCSSEGFQKLDLVTVGIRDHGESTTARAQGCGSLQDRNARGGEPIHEGVDTAHGDTDMAAQHRRHRAFGRPRPMARGFVAEFELHAAAIAAEIVFEAEKNERSCGRRQFDAAQLDE